jgi:hypothetical protein
MSFSGKNYFISLNTRLNQRKITDLSYLLQPFSKKGEVLIVSTKLVLHQFYD